MESGKCYSRCYFNPQMREQVPIDGHSRGPDVNRNPKMSAFHASLGTEEENSGLNSNSRGCYRICKEDGNVAACANEDAEEVCLAQGKESGQFLEPMDKSDFSIPIQDDVGLIEHFNYRWQDP